MLERTDRLALVVKDRKVAAETYAAIFDSKVVDDTDDALLGAKRMTLQWGRDQIELLEPSGEGPVADFLEQGKRGIFLGGFSLADPAALAAKLEQQGVRVHQSGPDRFVILPADLHGTGTVLSRRAGHERVGLMDQIWQITYAVDDLEEAIATYSRLFGLGEMYTNRYVSPVYGYDGAIIWFDARPGATLDSLEYLDPTDPDKAVARFMRKGGQGIYMASIVSDDVDQIKQRVSTTGPGLDPAMQGGGFIHPLRLHGLLLGMTTFAIWDAHRPLPGREATDASPG